MKIQYFTGLGLAGALVFGLATATQAQVLRGGFEGNAFAANDDGSLGPLGLGFGVDFFGTNVNSVWLNNNGNLTLTGPLGTFTPFGITGGTTPMIAPFFADVDTRAGNLVRYGNGTVGGQGAWGATWRDVCYFSQQCNPTNSFQVVLIDRSDIGAGDFDIEFNYDRILWETGGASGGTNGLGGSSAVAGWTNGAGAFQQLAGSGINGGLLDGNLATGLVNNSNIGVNGRFLFTVRNGVVVDPSSTTVPEPGTIMLLATGLVGVGLAGRRRRA